MIVLQPPLLCERWGGRPPCLTYFIVYMLHQKMETGLYVDNNLCKCVYCMCLCVCARAHMCAALGLSWLSQLVSVYPKKDTGLCVEYDR